MIDRPSSVIKELVENSLDAGSRRIEVHLTEGGTGEITVIDDGAGIVPEDLPLALERHATSKIRVVEDLDAIGSYGFRGEALSSIASVSHLELVSRTEQSPAAFALSTAFGAVVDPPHPVGAPGGTRVTARGLFARLPARQKFLRSAATEFSHCARIVRELALGSPEVSFFLHHQGKRVARYLAGDKASRFREVFRVSWEPLTVREEGPGVSLEAWVSPAPWAQDRGELFLFINHRAVRNRTLNAAIRNAYLSALGPHHEPSGVVYLDIRPDWVDVNVHPQKTEVRCLHQETLYPWLLAVFRKALGMAIAPAPERRPEPVTAPPAEHRVAGESPPVAPAFPDERESRWAFRPPGEKPRDGRVPAPEPRGVRLIGRVRGRYLLCEDGNGLAVVDTRHLYSRIGPPARAARELAVPRILRLPPDLATAFEQNAPSLARLGFDLERFGDGDLALKAAPQAIDDALLPAVLWEVLRAWREAGSGETDRRPALAAAVLAKFLPEEERIAACEAYLRDERPEPGWLSPDGHPVLYRLEFGALEKYFGKDIT